MSAASAQQAADDALFMAMKAQGDLANKAGLLANVVAVAGTAYTVTNADCGKTIESLGAAVCRITLSNNLAVGFNCKIAQIGTGAVLVQPAAGAGVLTGAASATKIPGQNFEVGVRVRANSGGSAAVALVMDGALNDVDLAYSPVVVFTGDSQAYGTPNTSGAEQAAMQAAYTPTPNIKVWSRTGNSTGTWVTYTPGANTGQHFLANTGNVGHELAFIAAFVAKFPTETLYIIKSTGSGSFASKGTPLATFVGSISGNIVTVTSGAAGANCVLTAAGVTNKTQTTFTSSGANFYVSDVNPATTNAYSGGAVASTTWTPYNGVLSWSSAEGTLYNGNSGRRDNGVRADIAAAMAALASAGLPKPPKIYGWSHSVGTNDKSTTATANAYAAELSNFLTRIRADFDLSIAKFVLPKVNNPSSTADATTVINAQAALAGADALVKVVNTDAYNRWDTTHWDRAGLEAWGAAVAALVFP